MKAFRLNQSSFLICVLFELFRGVALITSSIYHCCVARQKEFSIKVEMSKVESFYWNKLDNKSFSFESEKFFDLCFVLFFFLFRDVALKHLVYTFAVLQDKKNFPEKLK